MTVSGSHALRGLVANQGAGSPGAGDLASNGEPPAASPDADERGEVWGRVRGPIPEGAVLQAVLRTLSAGDVTEVVVAETNPDLSGRYRIFYAWPATTDERSDVSLLVRLRAADGELVAESKPRLSPPRRARINLRIRRRSRGASEYTRMDRRVAGGLRAGMEGLSNLTPEHLAEVAEWLDVEPDRLDLLRRARGLEDDTGLPGSLFYGLGSAGLPLALPELAEVPRSELRATIEAAVAAGTACSSLLPDLDFMLEQLAVQAVGATDAGQRSALGEILAAADLPPETIHRVVSRYHDRPAGVGDFWRAMTEEADGAGDGAPDDARDGKLDDAMSADVARAAELGALFGPDPTLLRELHRLRREGQWDEPEDLTRLDFDDWCDLLEGLPGAQGAAGPSDEAAAAGDDGDGASIERRAGEILDALEEIFPSAYIHQHLLRSDDLGAPARHVLERAPDHDFLSGSIRERVAVDPSLVEGLEEADVGEAVEEIAAVERIAKVTPHAEHVSLLVATGMGSAAEIAGTPRRHFIEAYGEALGGRRMAAQVHARAQRAAAPARLLLIHLRQSLQAMPSVLNGGRNAALKNVPDAQSLFGAIGLCNCEHCGSVYSPAAYFVDLLRYLDLRNPKRLEEFRRRWRQKLEAHDGGIATPEALGRFIPLTELLRRRPDLQDLPLTCENTLTPLPYIDLVNELLEARVAGTSAAFDTGKIPADVLRAVPQNVSRDAYRRLQEAVFPATLPFHDPLAVARAYLGHLGVTRLELMRTLAGPKAAAEAMLAEALDMSPEELRHVLQAPADLWRHFGFDAARVKEVPDADALVKAPVDAALVKEVSYIEALAKAPVFLAATGITFLELIDLVSTRFINRDDALKLDSSAPDCDPKNVLITGLDAARLGRMLRLLRLQRRLGWTLVELDRALFAIGAKELDAAVLGKLTEMRDLAKRLERPIAELLVLWAPLDTSGKGNEFERLFNTRAVTGRLEDAQALKLRGAELEHTGASVDPVAPALLAAFRITSEDLALARAIQSRRAGAAPRLDLAGLSAILRVVVLARALQLRIGQLDALLRLAPPEADPFRPGDPAATRRFADIAGQVQDSEFTPERLAYLFRHEVQPGRDPGPLPAQVDALIAGIRRGLVDAVAATGRPAEINVDLLRQKLALLLDAPLVDPAIEVLDPRSSIAPAARRAFFDRHLARIFSDPAAAAARLFGGADAPQPGAGAPAAAALPSRPAELPAPAPAPVERAEADGDDDEAAPGAAPQVADAGAEATRANVAFVLDQLLPRLRTQQTRGAVIQALADTLGLTAASVAHLLDHVLRSRRRRGEPLIRDFFALLGTGLTAAYFASPDLGGDPVTVRTEPELSFSWAGAAPAPGLPGRRFSVRLSGHVLPRAKAPHTFYLRTDGAVRLVLTVGGTEKVLIDRPAGSGAPVDLVSEAVDLDPAAGLLAIRIEYRNQGAPATLTLQVGTAVGAKQAIATTDLYPTDGLSSFEPVGHSYRRLHKAAMILTGFGVTDAQLAWLTGEAAIIDLDGLPMEAGAATDAVALLERWRQLAALYALRKTLPRSNTDLFDVFRAGTLPAAIDALVLATGWDRAVVDSFVRSEAFAVTGPAGLRPQAGVAGAPVIVRLARAVELQRRVGVAPATLSAWAHATPDADVASAIVQAVKARYDEKHWLEVARQLNDTLRLQRREALVAYLLPRLRSVGVTNRNKLFEYFLIDVDMNPCMMTSRIRQGIGTIQTFFQRCLMNLEPLAPAGLLDADDWKWMKNYRVWEANRKIFLYPENWIEPELRDDKTPLFESFERAILQQEINKENVEAAFSDYLHGLDEIARLDVRAVWFERRATELPKRRPIAARPRRHPPPRSEWEHGTYHVYARTFNAPYIWYYRRLERGRTWTAWEKVDADIDSEHLVPVMFQHRMHLFWTSFREVAKHVPPQKKDDQGPPPKAGKDWEIRLAYTVYDRGKWSRTKMSASGVVDEQSFAVLSPVEDGPQVAGTNVLSPSDYTLRASVTGDGLTEEPQLQIRLFRRAADRVRTSRDFAPGPTLADAQVDLLATFTLDGCNGALVPDHDRSVGEGLVVGPWAQKFEADYAKMFIAPLGAFAGKAGGALQKLQRDFGHDEVVRLSNKVNARAKRKHVSLNGPSGYQVDGTGFSPSVATTGAKTNVPLLAVRSAHFNGLRQSPVGGVTPVLGTQRSDTSGTRVVPVVDSVAPDNMGLYPFFFQDRFRSYFARPMYSGRLRWQRMAVPLVGRFAAPPATRRQPPQAPHAQRARRRRGGAREEIDETALDFDAMAPEARRAWEEHEDGMWHPDDVAEAQPARRKRTRQRAGQRPGFPPRPGNAARRSPTSATRLSKVSSYHEQKLRFIPFEHPSTCRLIRKLKADGVDGLLAFSTTRPWPHKPGALDHELVTVGDHVLWKDIKPSRFERQYRPGPLVDIQDPPRLDIDFDAGSAYGPYNWELFFHAPLQIAIRLAKDGRHEEAQRWFHFIFDPTTDAPSPAPQRFWRFAPFHENLDYESASELMALLSYSGRDPKLLKRLGEVDDEVDAWWEKPFSPHVIARLRIVAYQKAVVMKYIDNLVEWGDKLFRQDTMESIQEATQLYLLAGNILGPRPERIPPMEETRPATFAEVRQKLDRFSNWPVRFEEKQVLRPFRVNARPNVSGARAVLGMDVEYFCTPSNPQLDKYWDTVADRLFKIRNCMNIQGVVRQLALFEPPIDPALLVRAAAAGVDLGSVIANLNAPPPHHRFHFLLARATRLAEELRSFGAMTLKVLERRDAEALASLRAANETSLLDATRDIRKKQVRQVEQELSQATLQREQIELQMEYLKSELQALMTPQEQASQLSRTYSKVVAGISGALDLVSKVGYAIPELQSGTAGGFSSPFITVQLGGQMIGSIASAAAESYQKVVGQNETDADLAAAQAEYQQRRAEREQELAVLEKEKATVEKRIVEIELKLEINNAELRRHDVAVDNSRKVERHLRDKYTSEQLYGWMLGQLSAFYFEVYKVAFDAAQQAERAHRFERGETAGSFIQFSYWDSLKKGLFAGERLLVDLRRLEAAHLESDGRTLEVTRHVSLREDFPAALQELLARGSCRIEITEALLDGDFPGHYFRRCKAVSLSVAGTFKPHTNVNCTLTMLENRIRTSGNASGTYAQAEDGEDTRFLTNFAPAQAVATSRPSADAGLFELRFDDERYLPFEGAGAVSAWRIDLRQSDNVMNLGDLGDVVISLAYTARNGGAALEGAARASREKALARGALKPEAQQMLSLKRDLPSVWAQIAEAPAGKEIEASLPLDRARFSGRYRGLDLRVERIVAFAHGTAATNALKLRVDPPRGSGGSFGGWDAPWPNARVLRASAEIAGGPGGWKLGISTVGKKLGELVDDLVLVFELKARKV
jgi:hypothetical protein